MAQAEQQQRHVVAVGLPLQGHLNCLIRFCSLLLGHRSDLHLTLVDIHIVHCSADHEEGEAGAAAAADRAVVDPSSAGRVSRSRISVPVTDPSGGFASLFQAFRSIAGPLRQLILSLNCPASPVVCLVSDFTLIPHTQFAVDRLGIPLVVLQPCSTSMLLFLHYVTHGEQLSMHAVERALAAASTQKEEVFCTGLPGLPTIFNLDVPRFKHGSDDSLFIWNLNMRVWKICLTHAHSLVINTFHELETSALMALSKLSNLPIYAVGPFIDSLHSDLSTSLWKGDESCMSWLDQRARSSVLYVSFGSIAVLSQAQFEELLEGLVSSQQSFLFSFRQGLVEDASLASLSTLIPSMSCGRGFVVDWAPQVKILAHPSVGGFLTHCGWNSVIESITHGVPMLCWPYFADQAMNARCVVDMWKVGLQFGSSEGNLQLVDRKEVEQLVRSLMEGMEGRALRRNISTLKKASIESLSQSGFSHKNLKAFIGSLG